jgi:hypothetical protein
MTRYVPLPQLGKRTEALRVDASTFYMALLCQRPEWLWDVGAATVAPECGG